MVDKNPVEFKLDSFNLLNFILRNWKLFLITGIVTFIVSAAISLLITPRYQSSVVLYPSSSISMPGSALFDQGSNVMTFGDEEATEKILQMLQSDMIKDFLVQKYDLLNHYDIDPSTKYKYTVLDAIMKKNISFRKTRYMSVQIDVLDTDPDLAASMANDVAGLIDQGFNNILQEAGNKQLAVLESQMKMQEDLVRSIEDSIKSSGHRVITGYRSARGEEGISISPYTPEMIRFTANHDQALKDLGIIRQRYTEAKMAATENQAYTLILNKARSAEKKAFPRRSIITIVSTLSVLLFLLFVLMVVQGFKPAMKE